MCSGGQQRDSATYTHVSSRPQTPLPFRLPHNIKQSSLCQTVSRSLLVIHFKYISVYQLSVKYSPHPGSVYFLKDQFNLFSVLCFLQRGNSVNESISQSRKCTKTSILFHCRYFSVFCFASLLPHFLERWRNLCSPKEERVQGVFAIDLFLNDCSVVHMSWVNTAYFPQ